ncbi:MAG: ribonuclease R [Bacteroidetes bacterium]|nr:ribonuclease R [Bacteroidota bacterium]
MTKKPANESKILKKAILSVFKKHPTRNLNYKQVSKLIRQLEPAIADRFLFIDDPSANRSHLLTAMAQMVLDGELQEVDTGRFRAIPEQLYIEGVIDITVSGAAYVMNENFEDDIVIAPRNTGTAMNGDTVKVLLYAKRSSKRQEGEVVEVIKRAKNEFAGTIQINPKFAFLVPDSNKSNIDIFIPLSKLNGAKHGQKAVAKITEWLPETKNPTGEIIEVLGEAGDNNTEMNAILVEYGFPLRFPKEVEEEAEKIPFEIPAAEIKKRRDMRNITTFTIDPVDAKDFDDALSVQEIEENKWEIGIHIADVSHYLRQGMSMDEEAFERGTSVYLVDRVIPMLPEKLSNHVCSLRPNEDKLCYSAIFHIDADANVLDEWFGRTVIHSDKRFSYEEAQEVIENKEGPLSKEILLLDTLAKKLRAGRFKKGAITFEKVEVKFRLDEKGNPTGVYTKENKDSNKLIEEFMLLANRKVAEFIGKHNAGKKVKGSGHPSKAPTFVYRIHDSPVPEKLQNFSLFASKFGYQINTRTEKEVAHSLNQLMSDVRGKREQNVLEQLAIRTMAKAVYTTENIGHYGLAFDYYTHFTSPIRRYPDVLVHRLLDLYLHEGKSVDAKDYEEMCQHSTNMEIRASEAERASIKYKQVQYLQDKKGVVFDGLISGVTEWGFYVELTESKCEGLVRLRDIGNDFYELDEKNYCIIGHRSGKVFRLGDEVRVEIKNTDLVKKQIDFLLAEQVETEERRTKKNPPKHALKRKRR